MVKETSCHFPEYLMPGEFFPSGVSACATTRHSGVSQPPYDSLNLGLHVGDNSKAVCENRRLLQQNLGVESICWLDQIHGNHVIRAGEEHVQADACWTEIPGLACAIQVADCLPVLVSNQSGTKVGAAHAGWRGLSSGVIPNLLDAMRLRPKEALAWFAPCIGQDAFEVGPEVREAFYDALGADCGEAFIPGRDDRFHADLQQLARIQLQQLGCRLIMADSSCTYFHAERFFSYRREENTGRQAALIWIND